MDNGIYSKNCITDFPPVTYPTQVSIITGSYTGDFRKEPSHGVPLLDWMGRDVAPPILREYASKNLQIYKINEDMGDRCKTILEMVGDGNKASIAQFINRGSDYIFPERKSKLAMFYLFLKYFPGVKRRFIRSNSVITQKLIKIFESPRRYFDNPEPPIASSIWFMSSDLLMHRFGFDSYLYKINLLHIDKVIGVLIDELDKLGYLDETAIAITSDHGNYKAEHVGDLNPFLKKNGLINYHPFKYARGNIDLAYYASVGFFYFRRNKNSDNNSWTYPTNKDLEKYGPKGVNLFKELFKIRGSRLMFYGDDKNTYKKGTIHLKRKINKNGTIVKGKIEYEGIGKDYKTRYSSESSEIDIFNFLNDNRASKLMDNKFHSNQEWLEATNDLNYSMHPDLIPRHLKNPRSADIIICNDGKIKFGIHHGKQKSKNLFDHDLGLRSCMKVPLIIGGSLEIPTKEIDVCKITDIVPTLLKLTGKKPHNSVVGSSLI